MLKRTEVCVEKFELKQAYSLKKRQLLRCFFVDESYTLETTVTFPFWVKGTLIDYQFLNRLLVIKTNHIIL